MPISKWLSRAFESAVESGGIAMLQDLLTTFNDQDLAGLKKLIEQIQQTRKSKIVDTKGHDV